MSARPLVLISPAMAIGSGFYKPVVSAFEARGWDARALPRRGFERDQPRASRLHDWSFEDEIDDIHAAVRQARAEEPARPVLLLGHSLGGQLVTGHEATGEPADGVVTVGSCLPEFRHFPYAGLPVFMMAAVIVPLTTTLFGHLPKPAFGAPGARTLMRDWARMVLTGHPPFPATNKVATPALFISLDHDGLAPRSGVDALAQFYENAERWHYLDSEVPEGGSNDHVAWVRTPGVVVDRVMEWWSRVSCPGS